MPERTLSPIPPTSPSLDDEWVDADGRIFTWTVGGVWVQRIVRTAAKSPPPSPPPAAPAPTPLDVTDVPNCTTSPAPPPSPKPTDLWYDTINGFFFVYYDDGSTRQWVVTNPGRGGEIGPPGPSGAE